MMPKKCYDGHIVLEILSEHLQGEKLFELIQAFADSKGADAKPVRHGHWVRKGLLFHCSACSYGAFKSDFVYGARYCPICGARMDERTEE